MIKGQSSRLNNVGRTAAADMMPVMDLMPIEFSHRVIMSCIEEIKLRGLKHPHLFRNQFHGPSVEAALSMLAHPQKRNLFSVKMMRIDTVAGLLTTALSRTYPPLIPPHIQEMFHNPNGRFFFELLGMLPELNRYLFVEILDLCCALVDNQRDNQISHSKLSVVPGSSCFGQHEHRPNWDTRYLMSTDLRKFSSAFYHAIYAYREERDLTEEQLQEKLDRRAHALERERIAALEREHGYRGAQRILRMESRIAQGLPADSPMKEISLYADRKERVVADDAISLLDIHMDEDESDDGQVPHLDSVAEDEEENVQAVLRDLRRSISVASLGSSRYENQPRRSTSSTSHSHPNGYPLTPRTGTTNTAAPSPLGSSHLRPMSPDMPATPMSPMSPRSPMMGLSRSNTIARSGSLKLQPVLPGDIFGISQRAVEKRELESFMAVAKTVKRRKTNFNKQAMQRRQAIKMRAFGQQSGRPEGRASIKSAGYTTAIMTVARRQARTPAVASVPAAAAPRRERAKKTRKELEVYQARGLSFEEALDARENDRRRQRRLARRAKEAEEAKAEAEREAAAAAAIADTIAQYGSLPVDRNADMTVEEMEILEAFDYLSDEEFREFMEIAGLTMKDVEGIRAKSAAQSLNKVTRDIRQSVMITESIGGSDMVPSRIESRRGSSVRASMLVMKAPSTTSIDVDTVTAAAVGSKGDVNTEHAELKLNRKSILMMSARSTMTPTSSEIQVLQQQSAPAAALSTIPAGLEPVQELIQEQEEQEPVGDDSFNDDDDEETAAASNMRGDGRPFRIPHMTSIDMLFKHASAVGDANLRLYPTRPSSPTISDYESDSMHGGLLSRAASVMRSHRFQGRQSGNVELNHGHEEEEEHEEESMVVEETEVVFPARRPDLPKSNSATASLVRFDSFPSRASLQKSASANAVSSKSVMSATADHREREEAEMVMTAPAAMPRILAQPQPQVQQQRTVSSTSFEFETVEYRDDEDEGAEEAELRELLESMSEEERSEFLRLSRQEDGANEALTAMYVA